MSNTRNSSCVVAISVTTTAIIAGTAVVAAVWNKHNREKGIVVRSPSSSKTKNQIQHLVPWYLPDLLGLALVIKEGSFPAYVRRRRKESCCQNKNHQDDDEQQCTIFHQLKIFDAGKKFNASIMFVDPDDIQYITSKQSKLDMHPFLPDTVVQIHGPGNLQNLSGTEHSFYRKIFASILSPKALEAFVTCMMDEFRKSWQSLDEQFPSASKEGRNNANANKLVRIRDHVRKAQFLLMCRILYGMEYDDDDGINDEMNRRLEELHRDFELEDAALFALPNSTAYKKGLEASQRSRTFLSNRFRTILKHCQEEEEEQKLSQQQTVDEEKKIEDQKHAEDEKSTKNNNNKSAEKVIVGNAMKEIAKALIASGKDKDPETLRKIDDNLLLLLEAAHGTTMHVTTSLLYMLNHPDPHHQTCMEKVRGEMDALQREVATTDGSGTFTAAGHKNCHPSLARLKSDLPYTDACIDETMRIVPIIGAVGFILPEGKELDLQRRGLQIRGPANIQCQASNWYLDEDVFPEPNTFIPERWLPTENDASTGAADDREPTSYPYPVSSFAKKVFRPFGYGQHICLGMVLARVVMKANLYCFCCADVIDDASKKTCSSTTTSNNFGRRKLVFDPQDANPVYGVFPERQVGNGLLASLIFE